MKKTLLIAISGLWMYILSAQTTLTVDPTKQYQTMIGFGGSYGSDAPAFIKSIVDLLGASVVRYDIQHDDQATAAASFIKLSDITNGTVPFNQVTAKEITFFNALKARGCSTVIASNWSPPACLKENQCRQQAVPSVVGGPLICGNPCPKPICANGYNYPDTTNRLLPEHYSTYARYLKLWAKYFIASSGMNLYALSLQNEPMFNEPYQSALLPPSTYGKALKHVYDTFKADNQLKDIIFFGPEHMVANGNYEYYPSLIDDPAYNHLIGAWAGHGYFDGQSSDLGSSSSWDAVYQKVVKGKGIPSWMTENGGTSSDWTESLGYIKSMFIAIKYGQLSLWTIYGFGALLATNNPTRSLYNNMHFYRFIRPGAKMIDVSDTDADVEAIGFKKDNDYTVLVVNMHKTATKTIQLSDFPGKPAFFHLYRSSENEMCSYVGKISDNNFVLDPSCAATITYNATTPDEVFGPLAPANLVATKITDNSITVSWDKASTWKLNGSDVTIVGYVVFINGLKKTLTPTTALTYNFTGLKPGTKYTIEIHTRDAMYNQSAVTSLDVTTTCTTGSCVVVESLKDEKQDIAVSPNPAYDYLKVSYKGPSRLIIADMTGKVRITQQNQNDEAMVDVSELEPGLYILKISNNDGAASSTFQKL